MKGGVRDREGIQNNKNEHILVVILVSCVQHSDLTFVCIEKLSL